MFVTIITDCNDDGTMARQVTRATSFFNSNVSTVGIQSFKDLEGSGNVIDIMDAALGAEGVIMLNIAPRHGRGKKWPNGTPFGFFRYKKTLIVSTVDGYCFSLAKKFGLIDKAYVTDLPTVIDHMIKTGNFPEDYRDEIVNTQFRSFEYMPRLAKWLWDGLELPYEEYSMDQVPDAPKAVWWIDNFGNCKTTILPEEIAFEHGKIVQTKYGEFTCYNHLKDVPNEVTALIIGSSGLEHKRFVEFVIQGKSAAAKFGLSTGDVLID